jgi:hypothetical protein
LLDLVYLVPARKPCPAAMAAMAARIAATLAATASTSSAMARVTGALPERPPL